MTASAVVTNREPTGSSQRSRTRILLPVLALALVAAPFVANSYWQNVLDVILMACLGSLALNLLLGDAGQVSIGNAAFLAVGGLGAAEFGGLLHWPFLVVIPLCGLLGGVVGCVVGVPSLRIRGIYLLVATLALQYIVVYVFYEFQTHHNDIGGVPIPTASIGSLQITSYRDWYWVLFGGRRVGLPRSPKPHERRLRSRMADDQGRRDSRHRPWHQRPPL